MNRYALVRDGATQSVILWDGVSPYTPPAGTTLVPVAEAPPALDNRTLAEAQAEALARIDAEFVEREAAGITWQGKPLWIDERSTQRMTSMVVSTAAGVPLPPGFAWRMGDRTFLPLDAAGLVAMAAAAAARVQALRRARWAAIDAVMAATTRAEADAVAPVWPEGQA
jgi:hypothetical protein